MHATGCVYCGKIIRLDLDKDYPFSSLCQKCLKSELIIEATKTFDFSSRDSGKWRLPNVLHSTLYVTLEQSLADVYFTQEVSPENIYKRILYIYLEVKPRERHRGNLQKGKIKDALQYFLTSLVDDLVKEERAYIYCASFAKFKVECQFDWHRRLLSFFWAETHEISSQE